MTFLNKSKFSTIEELKSDLSDRSSLDKGTLKNLNVTVEETLEKIFDIEYDDEKNIRIQYNQNKTNKWLINKIETLEKHLSDTRELTPSTKTKPNQLDCTKDSSRIEAFNLVSQYIDKSLSDIIRKEMNLSSPLDPNDNNKIKRAKPHEEIKTEKIIKIE